MVAEARQALRLATRRSPSEFIGWNLTNVRLASSLALTPIPSKACRAKLLWWELRNGARVPFVRGRRPQLQSPPKATVGSDASRQAAAFHSSARRRARPLDFYSILEVGKDASQREIKISFYQLSKKYHPDVNQTDESAKAKFQQVSEAYATLGDQRKRREYDSRLRASSSPSVRSSSGGSSSGYGAASAYQGYTYDPEANANRRARASYAWDYQRRRADSVRSARGAARHRPSKESDATFSSSSFNSSARGAAAAGFGFGNGGVDTNTGDAARSKLFEELAARERRKEQAFSARGFGSGSSTAGSAAGKKNEGSGSGPVWRFIQVAGVFWIIIMIGNKVSHKDSAANHRRSEKR
ncbi:DnaJ-domain-containing protein [Tilletiaria anomala UBC 951]|uniref:DnaJ-domain-containing protein n=1 Tax=Tilletiaria anomala (strain ATCC 24038 / CBS 436.72 / UBC 951) TaxID=1037660 RepID=A0A066V2Q1_TILAU|nr:DnaJ-domain-containing protein [Tilletiaria anomala UBC 951]KDN35977.1 DnaJ-domain-containing protein [Tilletiaria anomala UBC 951]